MIGFIKYYNIYQLFTHVKFRSNIAIKHVMPSMYDYNYDFPCFFGIKGRTPHTLRQEFGVVYTIKLYCIKWLGQIW